MLLCDPCGKIIANVDPSTTRYGICPKCSSENKGYKSPIDRKYQELLKMYLKTSDFIKALWVHTEGEDKGLYAILRAEMNEISNKVNGMMVQLDAFEQNNRDIRHDKKN